MTEHCVNHLARPSSHRAGGAIKVALAFVALVPGGVWLAGCGGGSTAAPAAGANSSTSTTSRPPEPATATTASATTAPATAATTVAATTTIAVTTTVRHGAPDLKSLFSPVAGYRYAAVPASVVGNLCTPNMIGSQCDAKGVVDARGRSVAQLSARWFADGVPEPTARDFAVSLLYSQDAVPLGGVAWQSKAGRPVLVADKAQGTTTRFVVWYSDDALYEAVSQSQPMGQFDAFVNAALAATMGN